MQKNDYLESVQNDLEDLTWKSEHWNTKQEIEDWIRIISESNFLNSTAKNVIEQELRDFNGDRWELTRKLLNIFCENDITLPASTNTFAILVLYIFYSEKPLDLSIV